MFKINNWSSFQSYKDRNPPWIRFHKKFIDDLRFQRMSADARALLPMLWLMASEDEDPVSGMLRIGYEEITFRLRLDPKVVKSAMDEIIRGGFVSWADDFEMPLFNQINQNVTKPLQFCNESITQRQRTETESDTESEGECGAAKSPPPPRTRAIRIQDWIKILQKDDPSIGIRCCPDELGEWAQNEYNWDNNFIVQEWGSFCDYWSASNRDDAKKIDWTAAWRRWCEKTIKYQSREGAKKWA